MTPVLENFGGCPILVSPFGGETEPALSEAEGVGTLTSDVSQKPHPVAKGATRMGHPAFVRINTSALRTIRCKLLHK